jgi:hypothetical protein
MSIRGRCTASTFRSEIQGAKTVSKVHRVARDVEAKAIALVTIVSFLMFHIVRESNKDAKRCLAQGILPVRRCEAERSRKQYPV